METKDEVQDYYDRKWGTPETQSDPTLKLLKGDLRAPAKPGDVGYDMFVGSTVKLLARSTTVIDTGIRVGIPLGYYAQIEGRSSLAGKGVFPVGGIVDQGYTGVLHVAMENSSNVDVVISKGNAIAQLVLHRSVVLPIECVETLEVTERGAAWNGSTDAKSQEEAV